MKNLLLALTAVALILVGQTGRAQDAAKTIPEPSCDRINYAKPQDYLVLNDSFGDRGRIRKLAATLKAATPENTLSAIGKWIQVNLKYDGDAAYTWRNFDTVLESKVYGGCADHAVVFAALARANGIPAVFVKTMDVDWIREFRTGTHKNWRGHVFLEVYLDGRWRLLDASAMQLYDEYDPTMRLLPGNRYAYDKGADPYALLLSLDFERWKKQTSTYFSKFNLALLPVGDGRDFGGSPEDIYVAANSPVWQAVTERCREQGYAVRMSFNSAFERFIPRAKGCTLIITCVGDEIVLPEEYHSHYLPISVQDLKDRVKTNGQGVLYKLNEDGTRLYLIYGKDRAAILDAIKGFQMSSKP